MSPIDYKGVTLNFEKKKYGKSEQKISVEFSLNGSGYNNAEVISKHATEAEAVAVVDKLTQWAQTIINEHQPKK